VKALPKIPGAGALIFALALLALWQVLAEARVLSPIFFPSPSSTLGELARQVVRGEIWEPLRATSMRMLYGWALASILGVVVGAAIGSSRSVREYLQPLLEFVRPLPASAIIPPAILFLGLTNKMALTVIAFGAVWPVLLASVHGFATIEPQLLEVSVALKLSQFELLRKVAIPGALPDILAGARVSLAISLILAVVTEMQASQTGLGQNILLAQRTLRSPELYAGIVSLGLIGFIANHALLIAERRLLRWRGESV